MSLFRACPVVHVRKLACLCGHIFRRSKPLTTRNASREGDVSAAKSLEPKEQAAKRKKTNRECVEETREGCPVLPAGVQSVRRIPWTSQDPPLVSPQTQAPMLSRGSLGHPGILPWCSLRHRPPNCPEGPLDNPGSSLGVPSDTAPHVVWRIPWISRDPPLVPPQTQAPVFSSINDQSEA